MGVFCFSLVVVVGDSLVLTVVLMLLFLSFLYRRS